ncbi:MAG: hypothetical protein KIS67_05340 [Verrucomicrobiae bacterium]|nr:hypothetical protein [Verrucomicrobiae bacterium]
MDGRGRWIDNRFIERLWRSVKQEDIYLQDYADGLTAHRGLARWFGDYSPPPAPSLGLCDAQRRIIRPSRMGQARGLAVAIGGE